MNITKSKLENLEDYSPGRLAVQVENTIEDVILGYYNVLLQQEQLKVLKTVMELSDDRYQYELKRQSLGGSVTYNVLAGTECLSHRQGQFYEPGSGGAKYHAEPQLSSWGKNPVPTWRFSESFEADTSEYMLADLLSQNEIQQPDPEKSVYQPAAEENETSLKRISLLPNPFPWCRYWNLRTHLVFTLASQTLNNGSLTPYGNLRLSYDIYSAGVRKRSVEIARINEEVAQVEIEEMEHALTNELFNLFDYYGVRLELLNVANENLEAAELNLSISEDKYRSGVINSFNYRDIQLIYLNAALGGFRPSIT